MLEGQHWWFWIKFDVVTPSKVLFNPNGFDHWLAIYNTHLDILSFGEIFLIFS